jgi:hypothetical protein
LIVFRLLDAIVENDNLFVEAVIGLGGSLAGTSGGICSDTLFTLCCSEWLVSGRANSTSISKPFFSSMVKICLRRVPARAKRNEYQTSCQLIDVVLFVETDQQLRTEEKE